MPQSSGGFTPGMLWGLCQAATMPGDIWRGKAVTLWQWKRKEGVRVQLFSLREHSGWSKLSH